MIDLHVGTLLIVGFALLAMTVLPGLFRARPLSLPLVYVAYGWAVFSFFEPFAAPTPVASITDAKIVEYATELIVIVSLAVVGLSLERPIGWRTWSPVWRLLGIAMPITIVAAALSGSALLGLGTASAVLLGAVLAPTDPVLADEVQVSGPAAEHGRGEVRFALTAEAGLNDSLAFPVVYLAIALVGSSIGAEAGSWLAMDVLYRIVVGIAVGWAVGRALVFLSTRSIGPARNGTNAGLFAIAATLLTYAVTEVVSGYGFLAVFVAALSRTGDDDFRVEVHSFAEQIEALLMATTLTGLGALVAAGILDDLDVTGVLFAALLVFVVRPLGAWLSFSGSNMGPVCRFAVSFLGIRGMGSLYYLAFATTHGDFDTDELGVVWSTVVFVILVSVVIHGFTAPLIMRRIDDE